MMPTVRHGYVRRLLERGAATVVSRDPFTVRLTASDDAATRPIIFGIDPGSTIGLAAITPDGKPLLLAEVATRSHGIPALMKDRAAARTGRRRCRRQKMQRRARANGTVFEGEREFFLQGKDPKTEERHAPLVCKLTKPKLARINNRKNKEACYQMTDDALRRLGESGVPAHVLGALATISAKKFPRQNELIPALRACLGEEDAKTYKAAIVKESYSDWITPTVAHLLETHKQAIRRVMALLPVSQIVLEYAAFDIHKIQNPDVAGVGYQQGTLYGWGYENLKQYVLERDGHRCQHCKAQQKLHVHHLIWRRNGGADTHQNLITLCKTCHDLVHTNAAENAKLVKKFGGHGKRFQKTTMLNTIMPRLVEWLQDEMTIPVKLTYGYITKITRKQHKLQKSHAIDAYAMALRAADAPPDPDVAACPVWNISQERRHDRKLITRIEDRKYYAPDAHGKKGKAIAKNKDKREGQADHALSDVRPTLSETQISRLRVEPGKKAIKSAYSEITKGAKVRYHGKVYVTRGFASYGTRLYLHGIKQPVPTKQCQPIMKNTGMIWSLPQPQTNLDANNADSAPHD